MRWDLARQVRQTLNDAQCSLPVRTRELHIVQSGESSEATPMRVAATSRAITQ
jgi:small conductance mechanosensitive channel